MCGDGRGPTDGEILSTFSQVEDYCVPASAQPKTRAVIRQILALVAERTDNQDPRKITTAQEISYNCSGVDTPDSGRRYMHRIAGREEGWGCVPGFDLRRNQKAYKWPNGKLELLFNREAYFEGNTLPGGYTIRFKHLEDVR